MKGHMNNISPCLNLIFKVQFFFPQTFNLNSLKPNVFIQVSVAARYRLKSISHKDKSMLLRCTSLHSYKLCYIAETLPEKRLLCDVLSFLPGNESVCAIRCIAMGYRGGYCEKGVCVCRE